MPPLNHRSTSKHSRTAVIKALACAGVSVGLVTTSLADEAALGSVAASSTGRTLGFAMTSFEKMIYQGDDRTDCPDGFVRRGYDGLLATLSQPERERLHRPENAAERKKLKEAGHRGYETMCLMPEWLPAKPQRMVQGPISYGMDLDGGDTTDNPAPHSCRHQNFRGPEGEAGIDNQYYRVVGCMDTYFRDGMKNVETNSYMRDGVATNLIEVTGVDDLINDDEVMVGLYAGADPVEVAIGDGTDVLSHASLEIDTNPRFAADKHVPVRGRIENGILTTDPIDFIFRVPMPGEEAQYKFRGGRLKLELLPDGTAKGMIAAYYDVESAYWEAAVLASVAETGYFCPGFHAALKAMADGYPDPKTGECTAISSAYGITAVPAFVIHPTAEQFAAAAAAKAPEPPYGWERTVEKRIGLAGENEPYVERLLKQREFLQPMVERELARRAGAEVKNANNAK